MDVHINALTLKLANMKLIPRHRCRKRAMKIKYLQKRLRCFPVPFLDCNIKRRLSAFCILGRIKRQESPNFELSMFWIYIWYGYTFHTHTHDKCTCHNGCRLRSKLSKKPHLHVQRKMTKSRSLRTTSIQIRISIPRFNHHWRRNSGYKEWFLWKRANVNNQGIHAVTLRDWWQLEKKRKWRNNQCKKVYLCLSIRRCCAVRKLKTT